MYAMQYAINLPADYDMQIIRDRVAATGHLMDGFAGLEFKAYLIREKARGATRNAYAPFYVWRDIDGMRSFCWGESGYSSIVRDFGRQPIQDWTVVRLVPGPAPYADARSLTAGRADRPAGDRLRGAPRLHRALTRRRAPVHWMIDSGGGGWVGLSSAGSRGFSVVEIGPVPA